MSQVIRKGIQDQAINNSKVDPTDTYTITGLRVDQNNAVGRVGIGISNPLDALHIRKIDSSVGLMLDLVNGERYQIYTDATGLLNFRDSTTDNLFTIGTTNEVGYVGINTAAIEDHLHISSPSTDAALRLDLDNGASGRAHRLVSDADGAFRIIDVDDATTRAQIVDDGTLTYYSDATFVGTVEMAGFKMPTNVTNNYVLISDGNGVGTWQVIVADSDWVLDGTDMYSGVPGNIGIGSTNPTYKLDVVGTVKMDSFVMPTSPTNDYVLTSDGNGNGTWQYHDTTDYDWYMSGINMLSGVSGNVGIGIANPLYKLDVQHVGSPFIANFACGGFDGMIRVTSSSGTVYAGINSGSTFIGSTSSLSGNNLVILDDGNVGIGITNPTNKLSVVDTNVIIASFSSNAGEAAIRVRDGTTIGYFGASDSMIYMGLSPSISNSYVTIDSVGNVGIGTIISDGTILPDAALHVYSGSAGIITPISVANELAIENDDSGGMSILTPDSSSNIIAFGSPSDNVGAFVSWEYDASTMSISTGMDDGGIYINTADEVNAMIIDSNQNVGIGVSPVAYRLNVLTSDEIVASFESSGDEGVIQIVNGASYTYVVTDLEVTSIGGNASLHAGNLNIDNTTGDVGIGTTTPGNKLEVVGTAEMTSFLMPTGALNGNVLKTDGVGEGTWQGADGDWVIDGTDMYSGVSGNVGVGTATPGFKLDVYHSSFPFLPNFQSGTDTAMFRISDNDSSVYVGVKDSRFFFGGVDSLHGNNIVVYGSGEVGIGVTNPTIKLDVVGNARISAIGSSGFGGTTALYFDSTGELTSNSSDIRLKNDIVNLENVLEKVSKLRGVDFKWRQSDEPMVGMIAQELQEGYPELVFTNKTTGYMGIRYEELTAVLLESIKESSLELSEMESNIESLESKISEMMNM